MLIVAEAYANVTFVELLPLRDAWPRNRSPTTWSRSSRPRAPQSATFRCRTGAGIVWNFLTQKSVDRPGRRRAFAERRARLEAVEVADRLELVGAGSQAEMLGLYFARRAPAHRPPDAPEPHLALRHQRPALQGRDQGQGAFGLLGLIKVWPEGAQTDAYQANRNLILSATARADSIPNLEIGANDVRCTHGATVAQIEEEYIFYLMSRGIAAHRGREVDRRRFLRRGHRARPGRVGAATVRRAIDQKIGYTV